MRRATLAEYLLYIGQRPLRAGRVALAVIAWQADFDSYAKLGAAITQPPSGSSNPREGHPYVKARTPGEIRYPRNVLTAAKLGFRWGAVEHRLRAGKLRSADARWVARQWREGVPV